jgi:phosphopantetheine--protein transferase-like protein
MKANSPGNRGDPKNPAGGRSVRWRAPVSPEASASALANKAADDQVRLATRHLAPNDIEIWRASLDTQPPIVVEGLSRLLSVDEMERARRFFFERDRLRFVVGRGILRTLLGGYLGRAPHEIVFCYGPNEKPALATPDGAAPPIFFNVAHSEDLVLFAFTPAGEIGVDVERIREIPDWESIAEMSFSPQELARLRRCPEHRRRRDFFCTWTRQEALLKAAGVGLVGAAKCGADYRVHGLDVGTEFVGALAVAATAGEVLDFSSATTDRRSRIRTVEFGAPAADLT